MGEKSNWGLYKNYCKDPFLLPEVSSGTWHVAALHGGYQKSCMTLSTSCLDYSGIRTYSGLMFRV